MPIDIDSIKPTTRLHEVFDPQMQAIIKTGGALACARYINSLPVNRRDRMVLRPAGR